MAAAWSRAGRAMQRLQQTMMGLSTRMKMKAAAAAVAAAAHPHCGQQQQQEQEKKEEQQAAQIVAALRLHQQATIGIMVLHRLLFLGYSMLHWD